MLDKENFERQQPLVDAVNLAASRARVAWLAFLSLSAYLAVVVGNTTYRDLFLESPVKLPIIDVELPLFGFFWIAPFLYVIVHLALLTDFYLLAKRVGKLREAVGEAASWDDWSARLDPFCFVQLSPASGHPAALAFLLAAMVRITVVAAPLTVLLMLQWRFVAYHHVATTVWHQVTLIADLISLVTVWPYSGLSSPQTAMEGEDPPVATTLAGLGVTALLAASLFVITVPGERLGWQDSLIADAAPLRGFGRNLVLLEFKLEQVGERKEKLPSLAGRDLRFADLSEAILDEADLRGAKLHGADLSHAKLDGANLEGAELHGADLHEARLHGADLSHAKLDGAGLEGAELHGADLHEARLHGVALNRAQLYGTDLIQAQLHGADLSQARLYGVHLNGARLHGADLSEAHLYGADFSYALPEGSHGALLSGAQLDGAKLGGTQLRFADLRGARLYGADLNRAEVWQTRFDDQTNFTLADLNEVRVEIGITEIELHAEIATAIADPELQRRIWARLEEYLHGFEFQPAQVLHADWGRLATSAHSDPNALGAFLGDLGLIRK